LSGNRKHQTNECSYKLYTRSGLCSWERNSVKLQMYRGRGEAKIHGKLKNKWSVILSLLCALQFGSNCFNLDQPCGSFITLRLRASQNVFLCLAIIVALLQPNCSNCCLPSQIPRYRTRMASHVYIQQILKQIHQTIFEKMLCWVRSVSVYSILKL